MEQEEYKKELVIRKKSLAYNTERINLIKERLVENNCCPTCYEELEETDIKTISPCCKNMVCHKCVNHWYNVNKKTNCIYCNKSDIKYDDFVIIKNINNENEVKCLVCNKDISLFIDHTDNLEDHTLYAECCKKTCCKNCLNIWYKTLYKKECLICHKDDILLDDFKNKKQHEEMLSNIKNGYKYIKKSKIQFLEYFISTKIINNPSLKLIIFSDYINSFIEIKQLFNKSNILYTEFDGGNISQIENQLLEFKNESNSAMTQENIGEISNFVLSNPPSEIPMFPLPPHAHNTILSVAVSFSIPIINLPYSLFKSGRVFATPSIY
jgi:hypothetical protein